MKINTLIFETLESIAPIETSRVSMFDIEDRYRHLPFFRFRFKNKIKEDIIYEKIGEAIDGFQGNLKWMLLTKSESKNYLLIPIIKEGCDLNVYDKDYFVSLYGEIGYRKIIDDCIEDVPNLAKAIYAFLLK